MNAQAYWCPTSRRGLTVVELLVFIAVIGVLVALTISAVQQARESSRRTACSNKLKQIGIAIAAVQSTRGHFPHGMTEEGHSYLTQILPQLELAPVYDQLDFTKSIHEPRNKAVARIRVPVFLCPSDPVAFDFVDPSDGDVGASYAANFGTGVQTFGYNGFFRYLSESVYGAGGTLGPGDVRDGLSHTAAASELLVSDYQMERGRVTWNTPVALIGSGQLDAFAAECRSMTLATNADRLSHGMPWIRGSIPYVAYNHVLPPNQNSCYNGTHTQLGIYPPASLHPEGVNVLLGDGSVSFVSDSIDQSVWRALGSRNGQEAFSL